MIAPTTEDEDIISKKSGKLCHNADGFHRNTTTFHGFFFRSNKVIVARRNSRMAEKSTGDFGAEHGVV